MQRAQAEEKVNANVVTESITQPFTKERLSVTDIDNMLQNKTAFTDEQIGNMYGLQLQTVLESFLSEIKDNSKADTDFRVKALEAIAQDDTDTMKSLIVENQEQFLIKEDLTNALITSEDLSKDTVLENSDVSGKIEAETEVGIYFKDEQWHGKTQLNYQPSSGAKLVATPGKTTTIIGSFEKDINMIIQELGIKKSENFGAKPDGFNLLNVPDAEYEANKAVFWERFNKIWLDAAVRRGDVILLATEPNENNLYFVDLETGKMMLTGFGKEYQYLKNLGYEYDATLKQMIKKR